MKLSALITELQKLLADYGECQADLRKIDRSGKVIESSTEVQTVEKGQEYLLLL